ncbi:related to ATPase inhibitor, mitochondrial [Saccharomycodes ludwigii]|uniref:ATPase inhibitor, mitochondrial n=1 Tax=Saccharomycodes ludwigii TaxID=36035 RepID=A0A376B9J9_9ASCO|nr:hypothetical protein SCDLUD_000292 [Saccharomycodes ludwigii]KAH3902708.1 hypothetical protein SCDLUD_000292 [Saccharomycodes ludwigii]SSD60800.1 related to ATPase inhibitor, mitochondrial [Saccharomycodes ludwigii]
MSTMLTRSVRTLSKQLSTPVRLYSTGGSAGSIGSTRTDGSSDNFVKRERAQEDYFIIQREKEELQKLKEQLKSHEDKVEKLKKEIDGFSSKK